MTDAAVVLPQQSRWPIALGWGCFALSVLALPLAPAVSIVLVLAPLVVLLVATRAGEPGRKKLLVALVVALAVYVAVSVLSIVLWRAM